MRYRGNKICPDKQTNGRTNVADGKHNAFTDADGWQGYENWTNADTEEKVPSLRNRTISLVIRKDRLRQFGQGECKDDID